jgi:hypothetical protein
MDPHRNAERGHFPTEQAAVLAKLGIPVTCSAT